MKVLVIGSGAREHAIGCKLSQSPMVTELFFAPGNFGTAQIGKNVNIPVDDLAGLRRFAEGEAIDLTVVGPEVPLVLGVVDVFKSVGLRIIGPDKRGAQLEGSKDYAKEFMMKYNIPTAAYSTHTEYESAVSALSRFSIPVVIKADGLAAGKGVIIAESHEDAVAALKSIFIDQQFGESGNKVVLEEFLTGIEASIICLVDGKTILPLETAQDYKRVFDNDEGPNTGGMGTYSPSRYLVGDVYKQTMTEIVNPTLKGIQAEGYDFKGIVFIGIMMTENGPKALEYNTRFGDPETQSILTRLESDLMEIFIKMTRQELAKVSLKWTTKAAVSVVIASEGYPDTCKNGLEVKAPEWFKGLNEKDCILYAAGLQLDKGLPVTAGGRVITATALGATIEEARLKAYEVARQVEFEGCFFRNDIGKSS